MSDSLLALVGTPVDAILLTIPKARAMARHLARGENPFAHLVEVLRLDQQGQEVVVLDVEVQRPQHVANPIRHVERIAVRFTPQDATWPEVLALRADFPRVPHLNLTVDELPRSLCLYDAPYDEVRLTWTAASFVERIRTWLSDTARGELHAPDQPLEPLLYPNVPHLILPQHLLERAADAAVGTLTFGDLLPISRIAVGDGREVYTAATKRVHEGFGSEGQQGIQILALLIRGQTQTHGIIARQPETLSDLHDFLLPAGIDLVGQLRQLLMSERTTPTSLAAHLVIVTLLPTRRTDDAPLEAFNLWAFFLSVPVAQLGEDLGIWTRQGGLVIARDLRGPSLDIPIARQTIDDTRRGQDTRLILLNPTLTLSRTRAALANGLRGGGEVARLVAIGMGALGSQVYANLVRVGYGDWSVVDSDYMLPHNGARHAIFDDVAGFPKAEVMAQLANRLLDAPPVARAIVADVLHPAGRTADLHEAYAQADAILDFSASGAVARHLARDVESTARRASLFITPSGSDAALLVEDVDRAIPLDALEMQYYRHLIRSREWADHLRYPDGHLRFGRTCRDVSVNIPQDFVALHAANGARALRAGLGNHTGCIHLWHADPDGAVRVAIVEPASARVVAVAGWTIVSDQQFFDEVHERRQARLPRETGGILLGSCDTQRKVVYVVDSLPSPRDSVESQFGYIRGSANMLAQLERVHQVTAAMIGYVGEWHSHPPKHASTPSPTDQRAFAQLRTVRRRDVLPTVMLIVGESRDLTWLLDDPEVDGAV